MAQANRVGRREATARWARRRTASVAVALAGAVVGAGLYLGNQAYVGATSPASCGAGCVTDGSVSLSSDPGMLEAEADIANANRSATSGGSYVSVVLLDPFTYSTSGTVSQLRMTDELRGAYLAQQAANDRDGATPIQLLLANEGTSGEEGQAQAIGQIKSLEGQDHIVAVAGMGLSTADTKTAAAALTADGMPMFGAVTTGDEFDGTYFAGFYQVIPAVDDQVQQLRAYLSGQLPSPGSGQFVALVSDAAATDVYSVNLLTDFRTAFAQTRVQPYSFTPDASGATSQYATITQDVCDQPGTNGGKPSPFCHCTWGARPRCPT